LIKLGRIKTILELGTYIGVSTLFFAEAVGEKAKVTTVEFGKEFYDIACENFARNGYKDKIDIRLGCAAETLSNFAKEGRVFDLVFLDAAKDRYGEMFENALACVNEGGLLLVDDVFMNGDSLNLDSYSEKGEGVQDLLKKASKLSNDFSRVILPIGNGLLLIYK
ncbi:MAG: class I SAM-dependent methyltransferase, partial [Pseudomonadota bacterium]